MVKKEVKKSPKRLSGWLELTEQEVKDLEKIGIGLVGAKKKELPNKKKVYSHYLFKEGNYGKISQYLDEKRGGQ